MATNTGETGESESNYEILVEGDDGEDYGEFDTPDLVMPVFGAFTDASTEASMVIGENLLNLDEDAVKTLVATLDKTNDILQPAGTIPENSKLIYACPGFTKTMINLTNYDTSVAAKNILNMCFDYISQNSKINKKMKMGIFIYPVEVPPTSVYGFYLKALCNYIHNGYKIKSSNDVEVGIPIIKAGKNDLLICGCCGVQMNDNEIGRHASDKIFAFQRFITKKWSFCPWCDLEFENDEDSLVHWFDENHTIVACKNIIGEQDAAVNDARIQDGLPLPYTPFIQAAIACFLQSAPLASIILCQKVTKIDIANTNELPACLSVEIAHMDKSEEWLPDCAECNERYYTHNVVHYSSIAAYDKNSKYEQRVCGHIIPTITKNFIGTIGLSLFNDMYDKMDGKKRKYGCSTFKTAAKKDYFDDEGPMRKRFSTLFENYRGTNTSSSKKIEESIFQTSYYSQRNHRAVMFAYDRNPFDKYHGGNHISVELECYQDDEQYQNMELLCENIGNISIFSKNDGGRKKKPKASKKENQNVYKIPVTSCKYAMSHNRLDFLKNQISYVEYDLVKAQEYRVFCIPIHV